MPPANSLGVSIHEGRSSLAPAKPSARQNLPVSVAPAKPKSMMTSLVLVAVLAAAGLGVGGGVLVERLVIAARCSV